MRREGGPAGSGMLPPCRVRESLQLITTRPDTRFTLVPRQPTSAWLIPLWCCAHTRWNRPPERWLSACPSSWRVVNPSGEDPSLSSWVWRAAGAVNRSVTQPPANVEKRVAEDRGEVGSLRWLRRTPAARGRLDRPSQVAGAGELQYYRLLADPVAVEGDARGAVLDVAVGPAASRPGGSARMAPARPTGPMGHQPQRLAAAAVNSTDVQGGVDPVGPRAPGDSRCPSPRQPAAGVGRRVMGGLQSSWIQPSGDQADDQASQAVRFAAHRHGASTVSSAVPGLRSVCRGGRVCARTCCAAR